MPTSEFTVDLDHLAVALEQWRDGFDRFRVRLGGGYLSRGAGPGFAPMPLAYGDGMRIELLRPHAVEHNDFLRRFLDRSGPGPHHLTFKVSDIRAAMARADDLGYPPVGVDLSMPEWQEAFLHPKTSHGIVVQLAQTDTPHAEWADAPPPPDEFPEAGDAAAFDHVAHLVADLEGSRQVFVDLLGGESVEGARLTNLPGKAVTVRWPRGRHGTVALIEPEPGSAGAAWLGDRPGRVHHACFVSPDPERACADDPTAVRIGDDEWELGPDAATGTRLRVLAASG